MAVDWDIFSEDALAGPDFKTIDGGEKPAQQFGLFLITQRGSVRNTASYGSDLLLRMITSQLKTSQALQALFGRAVADFQNYFYTYNEDLAGLTVEERFNKANLVSFVPEGERLVMNVQVLTAAGTIAVVPVAIEIVEIV